MKPAELVKHWRSAAVVSSSYGAEDLAKALNRCASELDEALSERDDETLNLTQAAEISGYSADHLGRLLREKKIPNAGRENAPRIRAADLPRKASRAPLQLAQVDDQLSARRIAESVTTRRKRRA